MRRKVVIHDGTAGKHVAGHSKKVVDRSEEKTGQRIVNSICIWSIHRHSAIFILTLKIPRPNILLNKTITTSFLYFYTLASPTNGRLSAFSLLLSKSP